MVKCTIDGLRAKWEPTGCSQHCDSARGLTAASFWDLPSYLAGPTLGGSLLSAFFGDLGYTCFSFQIPQMFTEHLLYAGWVLGGTETTQLQFLSLGRLQPGGRAEQKGAEQRLHQAERVTGDKHMWPGEARWKAECFVVSVLFKCLSCSSRNLTPFPYQRPRLLAWE